MEKELLKVNILAIAIAGFLMLLLGSSLYLFRDAVMKNIRFFLPVPPLGVAAYVFVFNLFKYYNCDLPEQRSDILMEILYSTAIATLIFAAFTTLLIIIIYYLKDSL